jgi:hypothetical protein
MSTHDLPAPAQTLQNLLDREAIRDCLHRYCRGIDRVDEACLRSVYWPDATDRHGPYQGTASGFIEWALDKLKDAPRGVHLLSNILIDLRGEVAGVESYFQALQGDRDAQGQPRESLLVGRYVDRFEKRGGEWRIAQRTVVYDWIRQQPMSGESDEARFGVRQPNGARQPADALYAMLAGL